MNKHIRGNTTFARWFNMLSKMAQDQYGFDVIGMEESWRELYDDYYSPREALDEDTYAGV